MPEPRLWIPGPTHVRAEILAACARPMIGHRGTKMKELISSIDGRLKMLFGTEQHVLVLTASGSAAWEAAIRCGVLERWCVATNGAFSERWAHTGHDCGKQTIRVEHEWGDGLHPKALADFIHVNKSVEGLAFVQNETSTGAFSDVGSIAHAVKKAAPESLIFVDCVSSLGGAPFEFDNWGVDIAVASSQKCLALPPGLAVVAMSDRYLERARSIPYRGYYLDLVRAHEDWQKHQTPATPAVGLFHALDEQLKAIQHEGLVSRHQRHQEMSDIVNEWANSRGFNNFVQEKHRSPTTACRRGEGLDTATFVKHLKFLGHEISDGYGKLKGQTFRIGHMGDHTLGQLKALLACSDSVLKEMGR
ncbi:MAG: alanine--glyoxylate aminotransferase family protein [Planctomycetes bacterium]|nr:alanine--glyoxylate aminotransferase family protein [Planctomycetota bacterium]